jgi:apolipoprotein N-acyltransferase
MTERSRSHLWLLFGAIATALGHVRWGIDVLAWIAPIFWLHHLRASAERPSPSEQRRGVATFVGIWTLAWTFAFLKITSDPIPHVFALLFALPVAVLLGWPYLLWFALIRRGARPCHATMAFASAAAIAECSMYTFTPFGTWGMQANAALGDLPLLQLAALTGATGIGFVLHVLAAALEQRWTTGSNRPLAWALGSFVLVHAWGGARLAWLDEQTDEVVVVAAVGTDADVAGLPLPEPERVQAWDAALFERTRVAARAGAQLVVWTEAATLVMPDDEPVWIDRVAQLARAEQVAIVAGYVMPIAMDPLRYENAYVLVRPDGVVEHRYLKHHPVPGEPAVVGEGPLPIWTSDALGRVSGAICYDYDFPGLAREHARADVDLVALPSSDWRGIDPIHTQMAQLRAIEGGHSIVRSTRFGLAGGIDPAGRIRGRLSAFEGERRILLLSLPARGRWTLYGWAGEWFVLVCAALLGTAVAGTLRECRSSRSPAVP